MDRRAIVLRVINAVGASLIGWIFGGMFGDARIGLLVGIALFVGENICDSIREK